MASIDGSLPVQRRNAWAAWCTSIPTPLTAAAPRIAAAASSGSSPIFDFSMTM